ncbi:MAG: hypothetical protein AAFP19_07845 [Bacteroidota bacterium]
MTREEEYHLIEQYLAGQLQEPQLANFEQRLQTDPALQEALRLHQEMAQSLKGEKVHAFRQVLSEVDQEWQLPKATKTPILQSIRIRQIIGIAASVILLAAAYFYLSSQPQASSDDLFAANFEAYPMILSNRAPNAPTTSPTAKAIQAYEQKDFQEAVRLFQALQTNTADSTTYRFYIAIAELAQGNANIAIPILEVLSQTPSDESINLLQEQSHWYLALAHLQNGNLEQSKAILQRIQTGAYRYKDAQGLLPHLRDALSD